MKTGFSLMAMLLFLSAAPTLGWAGCGRMVENGLELIHDDDISILSNLTVSATLSCAENCLDLKVEKAKGDIDASGSAKHCPDLEARNSGKPILGKAVEWQVDGCGTKSTISGQYQQAIQEIAKHCLIAATKKGSK